MVAAIKGAGLGFVFLASCLAQMQKIEVTVERKTGDQIERTDPNHVFEQGDLVRFRFKSSFSGFLYVMDQSTSGKYLLLFPKEDAGMENRIERNRAYVMPMTESGWFRVEGPAGHEILYWLVSPASLAGGKTGSFAIPPLPAESEPVSPPMKPRCDDSIFRARGECLDNTAGAKPVSKASVVPPGLGAIAGQTPRELTVMKSDRKTTIVANQVENAPFFYTFRLAHK